MKTDSRITMTDLTLCTSDSKYWFLFKHNALEMLII